MLGTEAYRSDLAAVNPSRDFPEPVWSYARRASWSHAQNPNHRTGRWTKVRHRIERQVEREDRWLAGFLSGEVHPSINPLAAVVCEYVRTGSLHDWSGSPPPWTHEARARLGRALAYRPADWWAVAAPTARVAGPKARAAWWVPRGSWRIAHCFVVAVRSLRRYLVAIYQAAERERAARYRAGRRATSSLSSDHLAGHPLPQRTEREREGGFAVEETPRWLLEACERARRHAGPQAEVDGE